jgi:4-amino-4-deoxy-L-arabinose transferase-like glycosyltransferase
MVFDERPSPARVSAAAAASLPRAALLALIVAYIVSGLFGRDPWQEDDATGFGIMWTMARNAGEGWLLPSVAGEWVTDDGPLAYWVGATSVAVLGDAIGEIAAARLPTILWFFVATAALWYAALRLARREEAQPVAFAFGGEASSRDYGRMLADVAVLLVLGTIGPIVSLHETTSEPAAFSLTCLVIYGLVLSLERPFAGAMLSGAALGLLLLARGLQPALWLVLAALPALAGGKPVSLRAKMFAAMLVVAMSLLGAWLLAVLGVHGAIGDAYLHSWWHSSLERVDWPSGETAQWLLRALPWYTWPLWPLAAWALYAWRHGIGRPHIALPTVLLAAGFAGLLATPQPSAADAVFIVAPLVLLAAFGAVSMRRAAENVIDWFAITAFSLFSVALWAYFIAMRSGFPPKMSRSVLRLTGDFIPPLDWGQVLIAMAATGFWLGLVIWRVRRPSGALWRGPMLAATGLITLWVAFSSLFIAAVDHRRSFASLARQAAAAIARSGSAGDCVLAHHLRPSHLAVFAFHGGIRFARPGDDDCPFALHRDITGSMLDDSPPPGRWSEIWNGNRPGRTEETLRLYRRQAD